jgi:hypothetical protein
MSNTAGTYFDTAFCISHHTEGNKDTDRHYRMLNHLSPLLAQEFFSDGKWLTVGDGLAREGIFLKKQNVKQVVATDIWYSPENLLKIKEHVDDAQELDISKPIKLKADFIFGKEVLHHLKRPLHGIYNTLDAADKGVVFIEPQDCRPWNFSQDSFLLSPQDSDDWESCGNYKYGFSAREICKMAWAEGLPHVMFCGFNDPTADLYEHSSKRSDESKYLEYLKRCEYLDELGKSNSRAFNLIICVILKKRLRPEELNLFKDFRIINNPRP